MVENRKEIGHYTGSHPVNTGDSFFTSADSKPTKRSLENGNINSFKILAPLWSVQDNNRNKIQHWDTLKSVEEVNGHV